MAIELPAVRPAPPPHRGRGTALILISSVCFGSSGTIAKPAMLAGLSPEHVATARIGLAALVLFLGVALVRPRLLRVRRTEWPLLLGYGLLGVAGVQLCYFVSVNRLPVGIAILIEFTSPVLIALWTRFVRRVRLPRAMWAGITLAMLGLALVAEVWQGLGLDGIGFLAGLGGAVCSASYFLLGEHGATTREPLGLVVWGMVIGAVAVCVVSPPWTLPPALLGAPTAFGPWHPPVWVLLVAVALFSTALAYAVGTTALRHLPAAVASVIGLLEPVVATASAWALLGEKLSWLQLLGALVLLSGAAIVQRVHSRQTQAQPAVGQERPASAP
ncbi:drug/metabolite transporter (DMT)-like permease [Amycolatopsis bartoniae]|uniref:Permease n=1 Tax=Amycolatopsis bartoniae TaxID=941986 RepID=A0A8H9J116_9PSEU|nr:DMT family transporter [Amycolatopsis bartoniae]MBB2935472.1 drug/metabolite transporter (DMT)-like permease [Amycolatopsis bartoniae]TVT04485.1 EamA family transporter [Amycolatopsis bartoniae]GHF76252.1 permease [Amycolatopsis bartoniae]